MTRVPFDIAINDDDVLESIENFMLTINPSSLPTNVTVGSPGQATVTIVDDDGKQLLNTFLYTYFCSCMSSLIARKFRGLQFSRISRIFC